MRLSFRNRQNALHRFLPAFRKLGLSYVSTLGIPRKTHRLPVATASGTILDYNVNFLFRYEVFPESILTFFGEWQEGDREMRVGDVIVQQAEIPPRSGIFLIFGVRVLSVYRRPDAAGFSYGTLRGHPESGTNEFSFSADSGSLFASVQTIAKPGLFLSRLVAPVFTNPYVSYCNRRALLNMKQTFLQENATYAAAPARPYLTVF